MEELKIMGVLYVESKPELQTLSDEEYERLKREVASLRTEVHRLSEELGKPLPLFYNK